MIKIKRKKNPNLEGKQFNLEFMDSLSAAIYQPTAKRTNKFISDALISLNIGGEPCSDCDKTWQHCKCEYCDECKQRICACDRNTLDKARKYVIHLVLKYLPDSDQRKFLRYLKLLNEDLINDHGLDKPLNKYIEIFENSFYDF